MIDFVDTHQFLRKALYVAMATMHFHIAKTGLFMRNFFFFAFRGSPRTIWRQFKLSLGCKVGHFCSEVDGFRPKSVYL